MPDLPPIPRTRRGMRSPAILDRYLAMWLDRDDLTNAERRRVTDERDRRREGEPGPPLGVIVGSGGATPAQLGYLRGAIAPAAVVHHGGLRAIHRACLDAGAASVRHDTFSRTPDETDKSIVRAARRVVVLAPGPTEPVSKPSGPWAMARYARHRNLPTTVVLPDGALHTNPNERKLRV